MHLQKTRAHNTDITHRPVQPWAHGANNLNTSDDLALALCQQSPAIVPSKNNRLPFSLTRLLKFGLPTKTEGAESGIQLDRSPPSPETPTGPCMSGR